MFSVRQKRAIADAVHKILRETNHPELPKGEIIFSLHVRGAESWSWADIRNNGAVDNPNVNPWNEKQDMANPQKREKVDISKALEMARCAEINIENVEKMMPILKAHPLLPIVKLQIKEVIKNLEEK